VGTEAMGSDMVLEPTSAKGKPTIPDNKNYTDYPGAITNNHHNKQRQLRLFTPNFEPNKALEELRSLDVKNITPIQAMNKLYELQKKANENEDPDED
jgi:DNA mismatch repair protein MutS